MNKSLGGLLASFGLLAVVLCYAYVQDTHYPTFQPAAEDDEKKAFMESCIKDQPLYLCIDMWRHPQ